MRFHIGFSKRISIKKLIEILAFIFIGIISILGINEVNAEELIWQNLNNQSSNFSFYKYQYLDFADNFNVKTDNNLYLNKIGGNDKTLYVSNIQSNDTLRQTQFIYAYSNLARNNFSNVSYYSYNYNQIMQELSYKFTPSSNLCQNDSSDLKSVNFKISLTSLFSKSNVNLFNVNDDTQKDFINNVQGVRIIAHSNANNSDYLFNTKCELDNIYNLYANYTCNNVFSGNNTYNIDYYIIQINNIMPFNNLYSSSNDIDAYITSYNSLYLPYNDSSNNNNVGFKYSCSDEPPDFNASFDVSDDPAGLNDIYDKIKNNFDDDISGINVISGPNSYLDLIHLPFDVFQAIIDNNNSTCIPYEIDFSSIMIKWGGANQNYVLRLPCMRETLNEILGSNIYHLIDILLCFYFIYKICMFIVRVVSAVLSGKDLFEFFYGGGSENSKEGDNL